MKFEDVTAFAVLMGAQVTKNEQDEVIFTATEDQLKQLISTLGTLVAKYVVNIAADLCDTEAEEWSAGTDGAEAARLCAASIRSANIEL